MRTQRTDQYVQSWRRLARSGGKGNLSLVLCKHDTREAQCNHLRLALAMDRLAHPDMATAMEVDGEGDLEDMLGRRELCIEGILDTHDPAFDPATFGAAIERVWRSMLLDRGFDNMEALSAKGQQFKDASCMVYGGRSMQEVALPALWQNLVHAANGRERQYWMQGGVVQCECDAESFELGDPMKLAADLALSTQLGDSDINLQHPRALAALQALYDA
ncbi:hypothetical protein WJX74_009026 [Apatococcus lobatus]|uniref:Uncharacterized protein n=1 Tax=Apatococcus lobatus TaxID=904363 RepID=A0AAW1RJS2_9CHLO